MRQSPDAHDSGDGVITTSLFAAAAATSSPFTSRTGGEEQKQTRPATRDTRKVFLRLGARVRCPLPAARNSSRVRWGERKFLSPARGGEVRSVGDPLPAGCSLGTSFETSMG